MGNSKGDPKLPGMIGRRVLAALLLPLGVVASHSLGYLAAGSDPYATEHAFGLLHGDVFNLGALAAAALLLVLLVERSGRRHDRRLALHFAALTVGQCGVYALMEVSERSSHGVSFADALLEGGLRWGLAIQLVVGLCAWLLVRVTRAVVRALREPAVVVPPAPRYRFARPAPRVWASLGWSPCTGRGPPASFAL